MNKIIYIAAAGLCAVMAACSQKSETVTTEQTAAADSVVAVEQQQPVAAPGEVIQLAADETITPGEKPVVVDFWATWCGPCMQFKPVFHDAAAKYYEKATFVAADVDQCKALAEKYGIQSIPTVLIMMPDGTVKQQTGYMDAAQFDAFLGDIAK